jgi:hypothetical protein
MATTQKGLRYIVKPGAYLPAAQVRLWDDKKWERFVESCCRVQADPTKKLLLKYASVRRLGGKGDKGRDVEALMVKPRSVDKWDLYQCKHYKNPLTRGDLYPELAKFFGHLTDNSYPTPANYFICAPLDCGNELHDLLSDVNKFKDDFISAWTGGELRLQRPSPSEAAYVALFDFSRIRELLTSDLIEIHASDIKDHFRLFGISPERPVDEPVPSTVGSVEHEYAQALIDVYTEHAGAAFTIPALEGSAYQEHFQSCRAEFFCAEGLARFSRDLYAEVDPQKDPFRVLLSQVHKGIRSTWASPRHTNGLDRMEAVMNQANNLPTNENPLTAFLRPGDLSGSCHHLANEGEIKWVR